MLFVCCSNIALYVLFMLKVLTVNKLLKVFCCTFLAFKFRIEYNTAAIEKQGNKGLPKLLKKARF
jgi:hypothetical protein